jgi:hypothetical protein
MSTVNIIDTTNIVTLQNSNNIIIIDIDGSSVKITSLITTVIITKR